MLSPTVIETVGALEAIHADWDRLAASNSRPFAAPAWALAWWTHLRPVDSELRVVAVRDDEGRIVGVGPFYATGRSWALLAGAYSAAVAPLSEPGRESEVAAAIAAALHRCSPRPLTIKLQQQSARLDWAGLLSDALSSGGSSAWRQSEPAPPAPRIDLGDSGFDDWLAGRSSSFRREARRKQRRLDQLGAEFRYSTLDTLEGDVAHFLRLHRQRRAGTGGSSLDREQIEDALNTAGRALLPSGRMSLLCLDVDGATVAVQVLAAAGNELSAWNSGFDERYAKASPSMQCILRALSDAAGGGGRTMSLGPGESDYKSRLADASDELSTEIVVVPGRGALRARGRLQARAAAKAIRRRASSVVAGGERPGAGSP